MDGPFRTAPTCAEEGGTTRITIRSGAPADAAPAFECRAGESVLAAAKRGAGGVVRFGCEGGGCGICRITIVSGVVRRGRMSRAHVSLEDAERGAALACRTYPLSDLVIALGFERLSKGE